MTRSGKQLSNPFSTGGGGGHFEAHVQALFVALMLTGGFAPCLPCWPIRKIKLQGKFAGYNTDDLIVLVERPGSEQKSKMLAQIKYSISITENNKEFGGVIRAAWNDFNNASVFTRNNDVIALITGPLSVTDVNDVYTILEWARHSESAEEFIRKVELTHFSSVSKRARLQAFKTHLSNANGGEPVSNDILFEFMKHFHLLGYDLYLKAGVALSLLHSLIGQYSQENAQALWSRLVDEVQSANKNAGTITRESLPEDLQSVFKQREYEVIPEAFSSTQLEPETPDWNQHAYASDLAIANLLGAWDENSDADLEIIRQLITGDYPTWIGRLREILQQPDSPIVLKNGKWRIRERKALWESLGARLFDNNLDSFRQCAITVLTERDPRFELPADERFAANIHGKVLSHSPELRKGMSESLALLGSHAEVLVNCSQNKSEATALLATREILGPADWVLWGSLNNLLPILAEAVPDEFLSAIEAAIQQLPCPFDELFSQEGGGITGANYLTGLLWALEGVAWDQTYLVRVCVILGSLASHDPGGKCANRPANSLSTILLPWLPQTTASIDKRKVALQTLEKEVPVIAWKLVLSLLPGQRQHSSGTHKPEWRDTIPDEWEKGVSRKDYWEQVSFYAECAVSMASDDIERLSELVNHLDKLPAPSFEKLLALLSSEEITSQTEEDRLALWTRLTVIASKHRKHSDTKWALDASVVSRIEDVVSGLEPENPLNLHRRLFSGHGFDLFEERGNWEKQRQKLEERRCQAIRDILAYGEIDTVIQFAESVESPLHVGYSLAIIADAATDAATLPALLATQNKRLDEFIGGYVWRRHSNLGWVWADDLDKSGWSVLLLARFLSYLPSTEEAWSRATAWLGDFEGEYWSKPNVLPYDTDADIGAAIEKLIEHGRPCAAIHTLDRMIHDKLPLDTTRSAKALLAALSSEEPSHATDMYCIEEIIKALQDDPSTDPNSLFQVEWAYLPLLDRHGGASPKLLESRLASDSAFFCEVIGVVYRSKNEEGPEKEPSDHDKAIATNAWRLLHEWKMPPGTQADGSLSQEQFAQWLLQTKQICAASGHLEVAFTHVGQVLYYCKADPQGLWIDQIAAEALNGIDAEDMRIGFNTEAYNSRGVHWIDPTGNPERELADQYRQKADEVENSGYHRFAVTLRGLSESYDRDAEQIIAEHSQEVSE